MTVRTLINELNRLTKLYDEGKPEVSDKEWDDLYFELVNLEKETGEYYEDSPTQRINYDVVNKLKKVKHNHPMLSLDKTKSIDELKSFLGDKEYIAMAKMDGLTCSLTYEGGRLVGAETRGNGEIGEDILHNAIAVKNIPNKIEWQGRLVIDGEIICKYDDFEEFKNDYKNPRNFASGSIRLLDSKECSKRKLSFVAWDMPEGYDNWHTKLSTKLWDLSLLGFTVVPYHVCKEDPVTLEGVIEWIKLDCAESETRYPIDGVVFKYNKIDEYEACGRTDHHFKGGIAYKFYDDEYETRLKDIEWTMGRTGILTPVAIFEPIDIDGTVCSRASLHNISIMKEQLYQPYKGQRIWIYKANQIIPQISNKEWIANEYDPPFNTFNIPNICPICGGETIIKEDNDSEVLYCANPQCEGKLVNKLDHFCGKKGLDIKGLSKATLEKLIDWEWVNTFEDIFTLMLHRSEWIKKSGFGVASVDKILNAIEESKSTTLNKVIAAAGIPLIGSTVAKQLSILNNGSYVSFRECIEADWDWTQYDGIGDVMCNAINNFDYTELDDVINYLDLEVKEQKAGLINPLEGKTFCITGKLGKIFKNRAELTADIESKGGKVVSSISKKVDYLINNDESSTSAKANQAKALHIKVLTEEKYIIMTETN